MDNFGRNQERKHIHPTRIDKQVWRMHCIRSANSYQLPWMNYVGELITMVLAYVLRVVRRRMHPLC